jgi:hypothetical protein
VEAFGLVFSPAYPLGILFPLCIPTWENMGVGCTEIFKLALVNDLLSINLAIGPKKIIMLPFRQPFKNDL